MPSREDEFWASQKQKDFILCPKHNRLYDPNFGCQLCYLEKSTSQEKPNVIPENVTLLKCPRCLKVSLTWFTQLEAYECMNPKCKVAYTQQQYLEEIKARKKALSKPKGKAWFYNSFFNHKKKKWQKGQ
ncbi:MAG: hypothetical protein PHR43_04400 [Dehalococcoidales bacterium]|nr:hypothetical protein [Dehalococcoidales bacterium]